MLTLQVLIVIVELEMVNEILTTFTVPSPLLPGILPFVYYYSLPLFYYYVKEEYKWFSPFKF